jgi:uncharacterized protein (TIGR03067 family)
MKRILFLALSIALVAADSKEDASKKDVAAMQGDWACDRMERDGQKFPDEAAQAYFRTVKGNAYTVSRFKKAVGKGTFTLDATKSPKQIDITLADGPAKGKTVLGIYKIDGDTLTICNAGPGGKRPAEFKAPQKSGQTLAVWSREKK